MLRIPIPASISIHKSLLPDNNSCHCYHCPNSEIVLPYMCFLFLKKEHKSTKKKGACQYSRQTPFHKMMLFIQIRIRRISLRYCSRYLLPFAVHVPFRMLEFLHFQHHYPASYTMYDGNIHDADKTGMNESR